jgi:putrescine transport system ATP-binding protein
MDGEQPVPVAQPEARASAQALVRFENVSRRFAGIAAVDDVTLEIRRGEFCALLGPSGCGKTTLLRMLAGFEAPDQGRIFLDGADLAAVPPHKRPVNMMFQNYALFPHMTVESNVAFGLRQESLTRREIRTRVRDMLTMVRLDGLAKRKPAQLSGGQRQRVALARALVKRPKVFLLDEPLAALDKKLRSETQFELRELQKRIGVTFIVVTHDQEEAMSMADRIAVMNRGTIVQVAAPREIYERPNSRWVAEFIGDINMFDGTIVETGPRGTTVETAAIGKVHSVIELPGRKGDTAWVAIRPEKISILPDGASGGEGFTAHGTIVDIGYLGDVSVCKVRLQTSGMMKALVTNVSRVNERPLAAGQRVTLRWSPEAALVLTQ